MIRLGLLVFAALLVLASSASAASDEIEHRCTALYPNVWQYFAWKDCVKAETKREVEATLKRLKEEAVRPCIAADVTRMENLAAKVKTAIKADWTLEHAQSELKPIIGREAAIDIPDDNIKERVLAFSISSKCDSTFRFLINVRAAQNGSLRWVRTWVMDAPTGYQGNYQAQFSVDFDAQRFEEKLRLETARRNGEMEEILRKQEMDLVERNTKTLSNIKITDVKMSCFASDCSLRNLDFVITNVSQQPITKVSFGWMLRSSKTTACPSKMATKDTKYIVLQPGERTNVSVFVSNGLQNSNPDYCLSVTDIEHPFSWQR